MTPWALALMTAVGPPDWPMIQAPFKFSMEKTSYDFCNYGQTSCPCIAKTYDNISRLLLQLEIMLLNNFAWRRRAFCRGNKKELKYELGPGCLKGAVSCR